MRGWGPIGFWYRLGIEILKPPTSLLTRREATGIEHVPPGGVVVAANHISLADPVVLTEFLLYAVGRPPRFLAKREMFEGGGLVARVMRGADQIPVDRHASDASRDPDRWPMRARTGVARLALLSGAPVVPVAQWGVQDVVPGYRRQGVRLRRHLVQFRVGPPVDLSRWRGRPLDARVLREATEAVMAAITAELEVLRGGLAPAQVHDPRSVALAQTPGGTA